MSGNSGCSHSSISGAGRCGFCVPSHSRRRQTSSSMFSAHLSCFDITLVFISPVRSVVVPAPGFCGGVSLPLVRSLQSGFLRFPTGSHCATSLGCISHTGRSFDWNNPSMNNLYDRTFSCPVPYIRKVGMKPQM